MSGDMSVEGQTGAVVGAGSTAADETQGASLRDAAVENGAASTNGVHVHPQGLRAYELASNFANGAEHGKREGVKFLEKKGVFEVSLNKDGTFSVQFTKPISPVRGETSGFNVSAQGVVSEIGPRTSFSEQIVSEALRILSEPAPRKKFLGLF